MNKIGINFENVLAIKKELKLTVPETLKRLKALGITSLDVNLDRLTLDSYYNDIVASGFEIGSLFCFFHLDIQNNVQKALSVIDFCASKKIKEIMVLCTFKSYSLSDVQILKQNLRRIVKYAENFGVKIAIENVGKQGYFASEIAPTLDVLKSVKGLGLVFDGGNFTLAGVNAKDAIIKLAPYVSRYHLKDRALRYEQGALLEKTFSGLDSSVVALGEGDSYIKECFLEIKPYYKGVPLVIEFPFTQENIFDAVQKSAIYIQTELLDE
ncbi:MAG: sugar phosphate isomerase/epimerase [Clostridia bacterium]|nr:sugar phosphate isomerase/epimerase [Clostridia bacterium]